MQNSILIDTAQEVRQELHVPLACIPDVAMKVLQPDVVVYAIDSAVVHTDVKPVCVRIDHVENTAIVPVEVESLIVVVFHTP